MAGVYTFTTAQHSGSGRRSGAAIGCPCTLTTDEGTRSCDVRLKGKPFAMGFGFTCRPAVCLMALSELADSTETPGQDAVDKMHLTVSVDPARNTLEQLTL